MISLSLDQKDEIIRSSAKEFVRRECSKESLLECYENGARYSEDLWEKIVASGWSGIIIPECLGGTGCSLTSAGVLFEELGTGPLPTPLFSSGILSSLLVLAAGDGKQKAQWLPEIAAGGLVVVPTLGECGYLPTIEARGQADGFVLNGSEQFVHDALSCTHLLCAASTANGDSREGSTTLFIIDRETPGLAIRQLRGFSSGICRVTLEDVKASHSAVLGSVGEGRLAIEEATARGLVVLCAYIVGGCRSVLERSLEYSRSRIQFGVPIGRFQRVQDNIIEIVNHLDAARLVTYEALCKLDKGEIASESIHLAGLVAKEAYWQACIYAHYVFGGVGYSWKHGMLLHTSMSRTLYHYLGAPAFHRSKLAALLGLG